MNTIFLNKKTKKTKTLFALMLFSSVLSFTSCSDDDTAPAVVNEEEVITTVEVELKDGTNIFNLKSQDLDGDGPNPAEITPAGGVTLLPNTTYVGSIKFLNELESPAEDITLEVEAESNEHQVFYTANSITLTTTATNLDSNGNPLGTEFTLTTGGSGFGNLTFTLIHEPNKPNTGLSDAGGETDVEISFPITVN